MMRRGAMMRRAARACALALGLFSLCPSPTRRHALSPPPSLRPVERQSFVQVRTSVKALLKALFRLYEGSLQALSRLYQGSIKAAEIVIVQCVRESDWVCMRSYNKLTCYESSVFLCAASEREQQLILLSLSPSLSHQRWGSLKKKKASTIRDSFCSSNV